jgi:hypothetical protein
MPLADALREVFEQIRGPQSVSLPSSALSEQRFTCRLHLGCCRVALVSEPDHPEPVSPEIARQALALWDRNRLRCGWFLRRGFLPRARADFCRCLDLLAEHGDRETYVLSRRLLKCL